MREQTAPDCLNNTALTRTSNSHDLSLNTSTKINMDAKTIDNIAAIDSLVEPTELIQRWKRIVKPGIYRLIGAKLKKYHEPKFLRNERKITEERLQHIMRGREQRDLRQKIGSQHNRGFQHN